MLKTTKSAEKSPASVDMAKNAEVRFGGGDNKMVERPPSKKSSGFTGYLTSLRSDADSVPLTKR